MVILAIIHFDVLIDELGLIYSTYCYHGNGDAFDNGLRLELSP